MNIGLIADSFSVETGSGIARYSLELLGGLRRRRVSVRAVCVEPPHIPLGEALNHAFRVPFHVLGGAKSFDLLHATSPAVALAFPLARKHKVVTFHDLMSLLCPSTDAAARIRVLGPLLFRIVAGAADKVIAVSTQTKSELTAHLGIPSEKISVVNYAVSDLFKPSGTFSHAGQTVGYVGILGRRKAVDYLLRAVAVLKGRTRSTTPRLVICGSDSGAYRALHALAQKLGIEDHVEFKGFVGGQALIDAYNCFDVLVLPSVWEGFGLPILEAQRCGIPVIIRKDAHIPTEVSKCCVKAESEQDMADKIDELLTNSSLRQTVIEQGLDHSQKFTWERTVEQTLRVYEEAMS